MKNIIVHCEEKVAEAKAHAEQLGLTDQLNEQLERLGQLFQGGNRKVACHLYGDFAPFSFAWSLVDEDEGRVFYNGGLIFHGPHDNGGDGGAPTFSVSLSPHDGWSIHS